MKRKDDIFSHFDDGRSDEERVAAYKEKLANETDPYEIILLSRLLKFEGLDEFILDKIHQHLDELYHYDAVLLIDFHIDFLLDADRFLEALEALDLYAEKPYISQEVNELVQEWRNKTQKLMMPTVKKPEVAVAYLVESLASDSPKRVYQAVDLILLNLHRPEIKALLEPILLSEEDDYLKHYVFVDLFDRAYEETIEIMKFGEKHVINFPKIMPGFYEYTSAYNQLIHQYVEFQKNVTIRQTMYTIFRTHAIYLYPHKLAEKDYQLMLHNYYVHALNFFDESISLREHAREKGLDYAKLAALHKHYKMDEFFK